MAKLTKAQKEVLERMLKGEALRMLPGAWNPPEPTRFCFGSEYQSKRVVVGLWERGLIRFYTAFAELTPAGLEALKEE